MVSAGEVQAVQAPPSTWHANVAAASSAPNAKLASPLRAAAGGPDVIVVVGATVSIVSVRVTGEASVLPAASLARTENVWVPSASVASVFGLVHVDQVPLSSLHWKVAPDSVAAKA